jgi:DNA processing protein
MPNKSWMTLSSAQPRHEQGLPSGAQAVLSLDNHFPGRLRTIPSPPAALWCTGRLPEAHERLFAIVGSRAASRASCDRAHAIAAGLAKNGAAIVSGGAFGIDAAAHEGALSVGAATFAVLGCGTDVVYPDRHKALFSRIASTGGLLSEYAPGTPPRQGQFPARNRIIAGLAEAVLVVEAAARSGALITARLASLQQRPLFAVPGSPGTDALLMKGQALPVVSAEDIEGALHGNALPMPRATEPGACSALIRAIEQGIKTAPELGRHLGMTLPAILATLAEAELEGCVGRAVGNTYEVIRRAS